MATYPFQRAVALGHPYGAILTSTQFNTVDDNAASGADGSLWTDVAMLRNWHAPQAISGYGYAICWSSLYNRWWTFQQHNAKFAYGGLGYWDSLPAAASVGLTAKDAHASSSGIVVLAGTPGGASANKLRRLAESATGGTWTTVAVADVTAAGANCVHYWPSKSLWLIGLSDGDVETSTDATSASWTSRTVPNAIARGRIAVSTSTAVIVSAVTVSTNKCIYSTDGTNWSEATLPTTTNWAGITYNSTIGNFYAIGSSASTIYLASSSDGSTWSSSGIVAPTGQAAYNICSLGRLLVARTSAGTGGDSLISVSSDNGASWKSVYSSLSTGFGDYTLASNGYQVMYTNDTSGDGDHFLSFGGG